MSKISKRVQFIRESIDNHISEMQENDLIAEQVLVLCEQEGIDPESLTEEELHEIFGAIKAIGGGLGNAGKMVQSAGRLKIDKIRQGFAQGQAKRATDRLNRDNAYADTRREALAQGRAQINQGGPGVRGVLHNLRASYEVGKQKSKLASARAAREKSLQRATTSNQNAELANQRTSASRSNLISRGMGGPSVPKPSIATPSSQGAPSRNLSRLALMNNGNSGGGSNRNSFMPRKNRLRPRASNPLEGSTVKAFTSNDDNSEDQTHESFNNFIDRTVGILMGKINEGDKAN